MASEALALPDNDREEAAAKDRPSEFWHPLLAVEALRAIKAKCDSGAPLEPHERAYLSEAISAILEEYAEIESKEGVKPELRADRALGLVRPRGHHKTLSDRNIRVYNRVEELRSSFPSRSLEHVYADVAEEANQGNFDSPEAAGEQQAKGVTFRDSSYRSDGTPRRTATSSDNIEKIHRAMGAVKAFGK